MLEYMILSNIKSSNINELRQRHSMQQKVQNVQQADALLDEIKSQERMYGMLYMLMIILYIISFYRAIAVCSGSGTDSKMLHLLFATTSPIIYLIFSLFTCGVPDVANASAQRTLEPGAFNQYSKNLQSFLNNEPIASTSALRF
jgi:hypothetical protein